ncbi:MAG: hypothetical protein WCK82_03385 [Bacteroidota bacterium]|jgi:hypothetical protein
MSNIQKTMDSLQPYVIGIRYLEGTPLVDVVFKDGWSVPDEPNIKKVKGNEEMNYHMIFSETKNVGLDELLAYVERTIKLNQEREKKHELLRQKVNELKEIFKKNSLARLTRLNFIFGDEELVPNLNDFDIDDDLEVPPLIDIKPSIQIENTLEEYIEEQPIKNAGYLDENGNKIELTEEEKEMLEEDARAEKNREILANKKNKPANNMAKKVELPPKRKIEMAIADRDYDSDCDCEPNEACDKCIDKKDL